MKHFKDNNGLVYAYDDQQMADGLADDKQLMTDAELQEHLSNANAPIDVKFEQVRQSLQYAIDLKARDLGFSSGNALILYAGFANAFQTLAQQFASWEVSVWVEAEAYKQDFIAGSKPMLTTDEAVAMMPDYI